MEICMKTTIGIPVFNGQDWIADAIESAISQKNCEVLIVDDGSTDNSRNIAASYQGIRVIHQVNKGLSSARNSILMNAQYDRILFLDADDFLLDNAIKRLNDIMDETDADVVAPSFKSFGVENAQVILIPNPKLEDFQIGNRLGYCALFKKSVLLETGGYSPRMTFGYEDMHLWIDLLTRGKNIQTTEEILWCYRTKENSMISTAKEHHDELMAQIHKDFYA